MNIYALQLTRIPNVSLKIMLRLGKTLLRDTPAYSNAVIDQTIEALELQVQEAEEALTARLIADNPTLQTSELDFDWAVDGLWVETRRELEGRLVYNHRGLDALTPERAEKIELSVAREEAARAQMLLDRLFGSATIAELVRAPFAEQVESMAAILRLIEHEQLRESLEKLVGKRLVRSLEVCQEQYEEMVDARMWRQQGASHNLRTVREQLRLHLVAYVNAVQSLYQPAQPETAELVLELLRPLLSLRESLARTTSEAEVEAELEDFVELELPATELPALEEDEAADS